MEEMYCVTVENHSLYQHISQGLQTPNKPLAQFAAEAIAKTNLTTNAIHVWKRVSDYQWHCIASIVNGRWVQHRD